VLFKLKNAIIDRHKILIFLFGMMLILCGLWTYEASRAVYEDKDEVVTLYTHHGSYTYTVPVIKANPLYENGTTLKMGMPAYYFSLSPTVDMSVAYNLEATNSSDIRGKLQTMVVATDKEGSGEEERIFWQKVFPLRSEEGADTWTGTSVTRNFSLNVSEIQSMVKDVQKQLECSEDATIEIITRVNYTGKINEENVQGTKDFGLFAVLHGQKIIAQ
jgi:hypothetical protein